MAKKSKAEQDHLAYLKLVYFRRSLKINQKDFAKVLNDKGIKISYHTYVKYETNVCKPPLKFFYKIANIFPDNEEWLKTGEGNISYPKKDKSNGKDLSILFRIEHAMNLLEKEEEELAFGLHLKKQDVVKLLKTGQFKPADKNEVINLSQNYLMNSIAKLLGLNIQWLLYGKGPILKSTKN